MAESSPDSSREPNGYDELHELPVDPDLDRAEQVAPQPAADRQQRFRQARRSRWPRIHWASVAMVGLGAFFGGVLRDAVGLEWPAAAGQFPWPIFGVNTAGSFLLAFLLVLIAEVLPPSRYLRPGLGTGFCGAFTTFSSVATGVDQLAAHGHATLAVGYVFASLFAGLAAASFGMLSGRSIAAAREKGAQ